MAAVCKRCDRTGPVSSHSRPGESHTIPPAAQGWREGIMTQFVTSVKKFLVSEDGPTAVEYAVMLALIVIVCLTAIQAIGTNANVKFGQVRDALAA